mmetsp:Transcript_16720/g.41824  ORF Transcript_16720/g.41824 Transcript_16720/m.41824 type:complete len:293 (+) Transcript_16720:1807-2685(+)
MLRLALSGLCGTECCCCCFWRGGATGGRAAGREPCRGGGLWGCMSARAAATMPPRMGEEARRVSAAVAPLLLVVVLVVGGVAARSGAAANAPPPYDLRGGMCSVCSSAPNSEDVEDAPELDDSLRLRLRDPAVPMLALLGLPRSAPTCTPAPPGAGLPGCMALSAQGAPGVLGTGMPMEAVGLSVISCPWLAAPLLQLSEDLPCQPPSQLACCAAEAKPLTAAADPSSSDVAALSSDVLASSPLPPECWRCPRPRACSASPSGPSGVRRAAMSGDSSTCRSYSPSARSLALS